MDKLGPLVSKGLTTKEIADTLCFSENEVRIYKRALEVKRRLEEANTSIREQLSFDKVQPIIYGTEICRMPEDKQLEVALKASREQLTRNQVRFLVNELRGNREKIVTAPTHNSPEAVPEAEHACLGCGEVVQENEKSSLRPIGLNLHFSREEWNQIHDYCKNEKKVWLPDCLESLLREKLYELGLI